MDRKINSWKAGSIRKRRVVVSHSLLFTRNTSTAGMEWWEALVTFNLGHKRYIEKELLVQRKRRSGIEGVN
jgi:hypothetical protein